MNRIFLASLAVAAWLGANAQNPYYYETLVTTDGTELNGYVESSTADGAIVFHTENAIRPVTEADASRIRSQERKAVKDFDGQWLMFLRNYPDVLASLFDMRQAPQQVWVATLDINDPAGHAVVLSPDQKKWLSLRAASDTVAEDKVLKIRRMALPDEAKVGVLDVYRLNDGTELAGTVVEDVPGQYVILSSDGLTHKLTDDMYDRVTTIPVDTAQALTAQSPVFHTVRLADGSSVKGVISDIDYSKNTITVKRVGTDTPVAISMDNYAGRSTERNPAYPPKAIQPLDYSMNQVYIGRDALKPAELKKNDKELQLTRADLQSSVNGLTPNGKTIRVSFKELGDAGTETGIVTLYQFHPSDIDEFNPVKRINRRDLLHHGQMPLSRTTGSQGETILEFAAPAPGTFYILSFDAIPRYYLLSVRTTH